MEEQTVFEQMGVKYQEVNGLLFPLLSVEEEDLTKSAGKYGDLWLQYIKENGPQRYTTLFRLGMLFTKAIGVNEEAYELLEITEKAYLANHKPKDSHSFVEKYQRNIQARMLAEEMVLQEIVYRFH